jgi:hypothetical protein
MLLDTLQQTLTIVAPLAVTLGVVIGLQQLRNQNRLRQIDTVMRLYSAFGQEAFLRHFRRVTTWDYGSYEAFRKRKGDDDYVSLLVVSVLFENMGLLCKRNLAPIDLIDDLLSGPILAAWDKARPIWVGLRAEHGQPQWAEWFEYLHNAMVERLRKLEKHQQRRAKPNRSGT